MVYLPTKLGDLVRANVGKYGIYMEHLGYIYIYIYNIHMVNH